MTRVIVIGGSGFIGTRLVEQLVREESSTPQIIDIKPSRAFPNLFRYGDVRSVGDLTNAVSSNSVIINLAAEHRDDVHPVSNYYDVNVDGARNICSVARERGINQIIFTSTVAVYGLQSVGVGETSIVAPFNDYGKSKLMAERIFLEWQREMPDVRSLTIIRPTVVFGEKNRGNVFNLMSQIHSKTFLMVGTGENRKSIAYVGNVAAFIGHAMRFGPGVHLYNYVDKPDFRMRELVGKVREALGRSGSVWISLPVSLGMAIGRAADLAARFTGVKFPVSEIRVRKFCANSTFETSVFESGFSPPFKIEYALERTVKYEFVERHGETTDVFFSE